jgi:hypothetical protein
MRCLRTLLLPLLAASVWLLTGAIGQQPVPSNPPTGTDKKAPSKEPPLPSKPDDKATAILTDAIRALDLKLHPWVQAVLWQQVDAQGLTFQAEGKYLSGPNHQLHLDLHIHLAGATGSLKVISDGVTLWESVRLGTEEQPSILRKTQLKEVLKTLNNPSMLEQIRTEYLQTQSFAGIPSLLQNIKQQMVVTQNEKIRWHGREINKLTAYWSENTVKMMLPANSAWPPLLPKKCCLYLEASDSKMLGWPHRLEWLGPSPPHPGDALLLQLEFRNPKLDQQLTPKQCAALFQFDPGSLKFEDNTKKLTQNLIQTNQMAQQSKRRPN